MKIVSAEVQWGRMPVVQRKKDGTVSTFWKPVRIGTKVVLDDAKTYTVNGKTYTGEGTVVRFNFAHGTISVQEPTRLKSSKFGCGFELDTLGVPVWDKVRRMTGFTEQKFARDFSPAFVRLAYAGHVAALENAEEEAVA